MWEWFARGFAGVLHYSALEKIWDKVIGGSIKILAYVAIIKVELAQNSLLGCHTAQEAIRCLTKVSYLFEPTVWYTFETDSIEFQLMFTSIIL